MLVFILECSCLILTNSIFDVIVTYVRLSMCIVSCGMALKVIERCVPFLLL